MGSLTSPANHVTLKMQECGVQFIYFLQSQPVKFKYPWAILYTTLRETDGQQSWFFSTLAKLHLATSQFQHCLSNASAKTEREIGTGMQRMN